METVKSELNELVRNSVEETLIALFEQGSRGTDESGEV